MNLTTFLPQYLTLLLQKASESPPVVGGGGLSLQSLIPTPYPFMYHFGRKGTPFIYLLLKKSTPFTYLR